MEKMVRSDYEDLDHSADRERRLPWQSHHVKALPTQVVDPLKDPIR
jgi:hypothetical protein